MTYYTGTTFSPLFIGSNPATQYRPRGHCQDNSAFSPLFIGSNPATIPTLLPDDLQGFFQSPIHRVKSCNDASIVKNLRAVPPFSPLFIGSNPATQECVLTQSRSRYLSVPYSSGQILQPDAGETWTAVATFFQSPIHRVKSCNVERGLIEEL